MSATPYDLVFAGEVAEGVSPETVRARLGQRFGLGDEVLARLFAGGRVVVKRGVDAATAKRYRDAFAEAGAKLRVVSSDAAAKPPEPRAPSASPGQVPPAAESGLGLAPLGAPLEEIDDRGPPQSPDTSHLDLVPGEDWTLVDCAPQLEQQHIPDISHLRLEPTGS